MEAGSGDRTVPAVNRETEHAQTKKSRIGGRLGDGGDGEVIKRHGQF
jgi:hypothetical protein